MKITFHGAARTVTGSQHLIDVNGHRIMLDCGLFQGKRKEAFELNRQGPCEGGSIDYGTAPKGDEYVEPFENIVVKVPEGTLWEPFLKNKRGT